MSMHDPYHRYSDKELVALAQEKRNQAHDAPKCISGTEEEPYAAGNTFSLRAEEWRKIMAEIHRRGIKLGNGYEIVA